jgi:hypothetical protein
MISACPVQAPPQDLRFPGSGLDGPGSGDDEDEGSLPRGGAYPGSKRRGKIERSAEALRGATPRTFPSQRPLQQHRVGDLAEKM